MKKLNIGLATAIAMGLLSGSVFAQAPAADASKAAPAAPAAAEAAKPAAAAVEAAKPAASDEVKKPAKKKAKARKAKKAKKAKKVAESAPAGEGYTESTPSTSEAVSAPESAGNEEKSSSIRKRANLSASRPSVDREKLTPGMKKFMEKIDDLRKSLGGSSL